jgi:hypothetical protein
MPHPKGAILTERDRAVLAYVGVARYASAEQVHRLFFAGSSKKQTYRRLAKLCTRGSRLGEDAYLRRLEYRRAEGTAVPVWALTLFGRVVAGQEVPYLRPPAATDVGHRFLEHTLLLNEVLAGLVLALRTTPATTLRALPFRWLSEDDEQLEFRSYDRQAGREFASVLKPDAILDIPARKRRLFLEAETGTQSITTAHPGRNGAVVSKVNRYGSYFCQFVPAGGRDVTWYQRAFPDDYFPKLVFLVHSDERKARVERAVKEWRGSSPSQRYEVLVFTFAEAAAVLAPYVGGGRLGAAQVQKPPRMLSIDAQTASLVRNGFNALVEGMNASRRALHQKNENPGLGRVPLPAVDTDAIRALHAFITREILGDQPEGKASGATTQ